MIEREEILQLIPHAGGMCLLDTVESWDEHRVLCLSSTHQQSDNPLRMGSVLSSIHLIEYGAQAAAVHGGLRLGKGSVPALLAGVRYLRLKMHSLQDIPTPLQVEAIFRFGNQTGWLYDFAVRVQGAAIAEGRLSIMQSPA